MSLSLCWSPAVYSAVLAQAREKGIFLQDSMGLEDRGGGTIRDCQKNDWKNGAWKRSGRAKPVRAGWGWWVGKMRAVSPLSLQRKGESSCEIECISLGGEAVLGARMSEWETGSEGFSKGMWAGTEHPRWSRGKVPAEEAAGDWGAIQGQGGPSEKVTETKHGEEDWEPGPRLLVQGDGWQ
jgi:hypothetical protein